MGFMVLSVSCVCFHCILVAERNSVVVVRVFRTLVVSTMFTFMYISVFCCLVVRGMGCSALPTFQASPWGRAEGSCRRTLP